MPIYDWRCEECGNEFESIESMDTVSIQCPLCPYIAQRVFPKEAPNFNLSYNPKKDICDWNGNTTQYYRKYNEAKNRGENVRLPEEGE